MLMRVATRPLDRMPTSENDIPPKGSVYGIDDAVAFLEAKSDEDRKALLENYASPYDTLFGIMQEPDFDDFPFEEPKAKNELASYSNLSELMQVFVKLFDCQKSLYSHRGEQYEYAYVSEIHDLGIETPGLEHSSSACFSLKTTIGLDPDETTMLFLQEGLESLGWIKEECRAANLSNLDGVPYTLLLTIGTPWYKTYDTPLYEPVEYLMNILTKIMLHDVGIEMSNSEVCLQANSVASSLWCSLLEMAQEGHVKRCRYCGRTIVALDERRPRKFCGQNCNKNYQRVHKFKRLVDEGMDEADAAKKSEISLEKCLSFWSTRLHGHLEEER